MFYDAQLRLLRDTLRKCRIHTEITDPGSIRSSQQGAVPQSPYAARMIPGVSLGNMLSQLRESTVYHLRNLFGYHYICFLLPEQPRASLLIIGPYLVSIPTEGQYLQWAEQLALPPGRIAALKQEYADIPLLPENSHLFLLLDAFYEHLWGANGFSVEYPDPDPGNLSILSGKESEDEEEDTLREIRQMEQRYDYENTLMQAVSQGQLHKAEILLSSFSVRLFEQRVADPLRNTKNYCIIMNTLLRKAAESGGVHPIHLDKVSSSFALRIEQFNDLNDIPSLMTGMFRTYCQLVRKHTMKDYSPIVQQAILSVEANLSGALNLRTLSQSLNISGSYLSTVFKKETGQTLTDYIANRRVERAMELLRTTKLQVQTIAQHCGIVDVHYFSRIFKRITGQTPREYREHLLGRQEFTGSRQQTPGD